MYYKNNRWTQEEIDLLKQRLNFPMSEIYLLFPTRSKKAIYDKLRHLGRVNAPIVSPDKKEEFLEKFKLYNNCKQAALEVGFNPSYALKFLKSQGLKTQGRGFSRRCRTDVINYSERLLDESFKYYMLGVCASDGHIENNLTFMMEISNKDEKWLKSLAEKLVNEEPNIRAIDRYKSVCFNAKLPEFAKWCKEKGITSNKSYTLSINLKGDTLNNILYFIRGFLDGDGSILPPVPTKNRRKSQSKNSTPKIYSITASQSFAETLSLIFNNVSIEFRNNRKYNRRWAFIYRQVFLGNKAKSLALLLPKETYMLERKTEKLIEICNSTAVRKDYHWANSTEEAKEILNLNDPKYWENDIFLEYNN